MVLVLAGAAGALPGDAADVINIIMKGTYFTQPATVRFLVAVEPNEENRFLWVEAESDDLYRASEVPLDGVRESGYTVSCSRACRGRVHAEGPGPLHVGSARSGDAFDRGGGRAAVTMRPPQALHSVSYARLRRSLARNRAAR